MEPMSLSETVKGLQSQASSALRLAAREHPPLGRVLESYQQWESNLRHEAGWRREAGLLNGVGLLGDARQAGPMHGAAHAAMKRSASEQGLVLLGSNRDASMGGAWATPSSRPPKMGRGDPSSIGPELGGTGSNSASSYGWADAAVFGSRMPTVRARQSLQPSEQHLLRLGIPHSGSIQELSDALNNEAARNLQAFFNTSRTAIRNAQQSIQETAYHCQQNLSALTTLIQHNVTSHSTLQHAKEAVTWSLVTGADPVSGALAPWSMFPMQRPMGRSRSMEQLETPRTADGSSSGGASASALHSASQSTGGTPATASATGATSTAGTTPSTGSGASAGALVVTANGASTAATAAAAATTSTGAGALTSGALTSSTPDSATSDGTPSDWFGPFETYMHQLDQKLAGRSGPLARSIKEPGRQVAIVTTASLPWLTGTSVNPLLRAAYLSTDDSRKVTLVLPWLSLPDQERVFPFNTRFDTPEAQEAYIRDWARKRTGLDCNFRISFYPGRYAAEKGSILPVGDITQVIPDNEADVAVLEEPEHLSWYHHGKRWTDKFNHVVGVMHTNYLDYARREEGGPLKELLLKQINAWVCRVHCHKVIKLSDAVQPLPREETMFVHGVSPSFLQVGKRKAEQMQEGGDPSVWSKGVYFIGKVLWAKGYTELLERLDEHAQRTGNNVQVDVYGSGPDFNSVVQEAQQKRLNLSFNGARDHADQSIQDYKVFVNPSLSDVVATTTAEALAMGKWVVCADHPSNRFFSRFPNCLVYRDSNEFSHCLATALAKDPKPLSPEELNALTWEAATDRFLDIADVKKGPSPWESALDSVLHAAHNTLTGLEFVRVLTGAGTHTRDLPPSLVDYVPCSDDVGGFFDNHERARKAR